MSAHSSDFVRTAGGCPGSGEAVIGRAAGSTARSCISSHIVMLRRKNSVQIGRSLCTPWSPSVQLWLLPSRRTWFHPTGVHLEVGMTRWRRMVLSPATAAVVDVGALTTTASAQPIGSSIRWSTPPATTSGPTATGPITALTTRWSGSRPCAGSSSHTPERPRPAQRQGSDPGRPGLRGERVLPPRGRRVRRPAHRRQQQQPAALDRPYRACAGAAGRGPTAHRGHAVPDRPDLRPGHKGQAASRGPAHPG